MCEGARTVLRAGYEERVVGDMSAHLRRLRNCDKAKIKTGESAFGLARHSTAPIGKTGKRISRGGAVIAEKTAMIAGPAHPA